jgi:hypothetical protein
LREVVDTHILSQNFLHNGPPLREGAVCIESDDLPVLDQDLMAQGKSADAPLRCRPIDRLPAL